jgi:Sec-independent protein translocase protein TatA
VPFGIGQWELLALAVVLAVLFGGSQLPAIGRRLGRSVRDARATIAAVDPRTALNDQSEAPRDDRQARRSSPDDDAR